MSFLTRLLHHTAPGSYRGADRCQSRPAVHGGHSKGEGPGQPSLTLFSHHHYLYLPASKGHATNKNRWPMRIGEHPSRGTRQAGQGHCAGHPPASQGVLAPLLVPERNHQGPKPLTRPYHPEPSPGLQPCPFAKGPQDWGPEVCRAWVCGHQSLPPFPGGTTPSRPARVRESRPESPRPALMLPSAGGLSPQAKVHSSEIPQAPGEKAPKHSPACMGQGQTATGRRRVYVTQDCLTPNTRCQNSLCPRPQTPSLKAGLHKPFLQDAPA